MTADNDHTQVDTYLVYPTYIDAPSDAYIFKEPQTRLDGQMSSASISPFGKLGNSDHVGLNPGQVKIMTLTLILIAS